MTDKDIGFYFNRHGDVMKKFILFTLILLISKSAMANNDEKVLNGIVKSFESAIINKDKSKFLSLFTRRHSVLGWRTHYK
jgi:uncharacterized membrane protein YvbJ